METRSDDLISEFRYDDKVVQFKNRTKLDLNCAQQLPTYHYVIERYLTLLKEKRHNLPQKHEIVVTEVTKELCDIWIFMNVSPQQHKYALKTIRRLIDQYLKLSKTGKAKRNASWQMQLERDIVQKLNHGFDIKATDERTIQSCVEQYGVVPGEEEKKLYEDNCTGECPRDRWCGGVDTVWWRDAMKRVARLEASELRAEKRSKRVSDEQEKLKKLKEVEKVNVELCLDDSEDVYNISDELEDSDDYASSLTKRKEYIEEENNFPQIRVRTGFRTLNPDIIETLVVMESAYKVDGRKAPSLLAYIANRLFHQNWIVAENEKDEGEGDVEIELCEESTTEEPKKKKRRQFFSEYDFVIPSRKTIAHMVKSFSILSFTDMAEQIQNAKLSQKIVTYGTDDTVKAGGNRKFDIKTGHITIIGENKDRETFATGFHENASHSGVDAAITVKHDLAKMAVLTNNSYEDMIGMIDYFMNDRAGDGEVMLDELGIEKKKRLKCNAHPLLCVENALDKVFKDMETMMGVSNLISEGASHCFNAPKNSVWYLGLIALAKLLSPSHAKDTISLFKDYSDFLKKDSISVDSDTSELSCDLIKNGFKGFQSNRFGRIGELSVAMISHKQLLDKFFDKQVNEHANKLVLAVSCYKRSQWFQMCCEVSVFFFDLVTIPLKMVIGMDEFKNTKHPKRSWTGIKDVFSSMMNDLNIVATSENNDGKEQLKSKCAKRIKDALEHQLQMSPFFTDCANEDMPDETIEKTPLTNLGCESEFGFVTNDFKRTGGSTSLSTISDKHIIARNELFTKERWVKLSNMEKEKKWKWAKNSPQAKVVKEMERKFIERVRAVEQLAVKTKEDAKLKKSAKLLESLELCKQHGGPLTMADVHKLDHLADKQVEVEASYLKKTVAPNIRFKRLVDKKFVKFTTDELRKQVKDAIMPTCSPTDDINTLIKGVLHSIESAVVPTGKECIEAGVVGWWKGPLDEEKLGVVLDETTLQLYELSRFGFRPCGLAVDLNEWTLQDKVNTYYYEERANCVYLKIDV